MNNPINVEDILAQLESDFDYDIFQSNYTNFFDKKLKHVSKKVTLDKSQNYLVSLLLTKDVLKILSLSDIDIYIPKSKFYFEKFENFNVKYYQYHNFSKLWSESKGAIFLYFLDCDYLFGQENNLVECKLFEVDFKVPFSFCSLITATNLNSYFFDGKELLKLKKKEGEVSHTFSDMLCHVEEQVLANPNNILNLYHLFTYSESYRNYKTLDICRRLELLNQSMFDSGIINNETFIKNKQEMKDAASSH